MTRKELSHQQELFVESFLQTLNATQAAEAAGYSNPNSQGSRLLAYPKIQRVLKDRLGRIQASTDAAYKNTGKAIERLRGNVGPSHLYIMRAANGLIKVGASSSPGARLKAFNTGSPISIELIFQGKTVTSAATAERLMHQRYSHKRIRGEWFALSDQDISDIISEFGE